MNSRYGQGMFHQKIIFYFYDTVVIPFLITNHFLEDFWIDLSISFFIKSFSGRKIFGFYDIRALRDIDFDSFITPHIAFFFYFLFGETVINQISGCIVEVEWIYRSREILS